MLREVSGDELAEAIEWCVGRQATVHFRRRARDESEVLVQLDDLTATAPTLEAAIAAVERKARARRSPWVPAHDPLVPYPLRRGWLRDDEVPHLAVGFERHAGLLGRLLAGLRAFAAGGAPR